MESSSGPFPYSTFLPTSSTSCWYFSSSFLLKWLRRSFFMTASFSTPWITRRIRRAGYHAPLVKSIPRAVENARSALDRDHGRIAPKALERVEPSRVFEKHVDDDVTVVEQQPPALRAALRVTRADTVRAQGAPHGVGDGIGVRGRTSAAEEKEVCEPRQAPQVEQCHVDALLVEHGACREARDVFRRRGRHQQSARYKRCSRI